MYTRDQGVTLVVDLEVVGGSVVDLAAEKAVVAVLVVELVEVMALDSV